MVRDFNVLAAELERCFGDKRELPSSLELREMGRCAVASLLVMLVWVCERGVPEGGT